MNARPAKSLGYKYPLGINTVLDTTLDQDNPLQVTIEYIPEVEGADIAFWFIEIGQLTEAAAADNPGKIKCQLDILSTDYFETEI